LAVHLITDGTSNTIMWVTCFATCSSPTNFVTAYTNTASQTSANPAHPAAATGPFTGRLEFDIAPVWTYMANQTTASLSPGGCGPGGHAQAYTAQGIQVGLADGGARAITPTFLRPIGGTGGNISASGNAPPNAATMNYVSAIFPNDNLT